MDEQIRKLIVDYLQQHIHLHDFHQRFAAFYFQVRKNRNEQREAGKLCDQIVLPLAELSRGHRSEAEFREELEKAIRLSRAGKNASSIVWMEGEGVPVVLETGGNYRSIADYSNRFSWQRTSSAMRPLQVFVAAA